MMGLNIDIELIAQKKHLSLTDTNCINVVPPACLITSGYLWKRGNDVFGLWRKRKFELKDNSNSNFFFPFLHLIVYPSLFP